MEVDDSFKKPGAIPFKWEIRPGIPKIQQQNQQEVQQKKQHLPPIDHVRSMPSTPKKLRPPPSGSFFQPQYELRSSSVRSLSRSRSRSLSDRWQFNQRVLAQPEVAFTGCFGSQLLKKKTDKKRVSKQPDSDAESDYGSDLDIQSRWSISTRKSFSPFRSSPSSFSSYQSSPRVVSDAEWAGYGLFEKMYRV